MDSEHPLIGQALGPYQVEASLGAGAMGAVYFGRDTRIGRPVAIKVLHAHLARNPKVVERFRQEARVLGALAHPNIVMVLEFIPDAGAIIMEFLSGQTLDDVLAATPAGIPFEILYPIFDQIGAALEHAHRRNVVHRDLKPSNVMLVELDGQTLPKVLDFGIAKITAEAPAMTAVSSRLGTAWYMAPEQIRSPAQVDARADVYALGVCLFHCATGRVPFPYEADYDAMRAHLEEAPPRPSTLNVAITSGVDELILRAMAKDPAERYPTAQAFRDALRGLAQQAHIETLKTGTYSTPTTADLADAFPVHGHQAGRDTMPGTAATLESGAFPAPPARAELRSANQATFTPTAQPATAQTRQPAAPTVYSESEGANLGSSGTPPPVALPTRADSAPTVAPEAAPPAPFGSPTTSPSRPMNGRAIGAVALVLAAGAAGAVWYAKTRSPVSPTEETLTSTTSAPTAQSASAPLRDPAAAVPAFEGRRVSVDRIPSDVESAPAAMNPAVAPTVAPEPTVAPLAAPESAAVGEGGGNKPASTPVGLPAPESAPTRQRIALARVPFVSKAEEEEATGLNTAGMRAYAQRDYVAAFKSFVGATRVNPSHRKAFYNAGCQAALLGEVDVAIKYLTGWVALRDDRNYADMQRLVDGERDLDTIRSDPRFIAFRERISPD
jgi:serine/threonine protein kinase